MPNNSLSVLYKHIIQVENKNVGLKVWGGGGGTNTIKKCVCGGGGGGTCLRQCKCYLWKTNMIYVLILLYPYVPSTLAVVFFAVICVLISIYGSSICSGFICTQKGFEGI